MRGCAVSRVLCPPRVCVELAFFVGNDARNSFTHPRVNAELGVGRKKLCRLHAARACLRTQRALAHAVNGRVVVGGGSLAAGVEGASHEGLATALLSLC